MPSNSLTWRCNSQKKKRGQRLHMAGGKGGAGGKGAAGVSKKQQPNSARGLSDYDRKLLGVGKGGMTPRGL